MDPTPKHFNIGDDEGAISVQSSPVAVAASPIQVEASVISITSSDGVLFESPQVQSQQVPEPCPEANPTTQLNDGDVFQEASLRRLPPGLGIVGKELSTSAAQAGSEASRTIVSSSADPATAAGTESTKPPLSAAPAVS